MQFILACMLAGGLLGAGLAIATEAAQQPKPRHLTRFDAQFNNADKNGDGGLSRPEAESAGMQRIVDNFDRLDANKDGKVTREEMRALLRSRLSS